MADVLPIKPTSMGSNSYPNFDAFEVLQAIPLVTLIVNTEGDIVFANVAAEQFFLLSDRQLRAGGLPLFIDETASIKSHLSQVSKTQTRVTLRQLDITLRPGENVSVDINISSFKALESSDNQLILLTISESSELGGAVAEKSDKVASLADMLAHEVKNPLSGIRGAAQLLEQTAKEEDKKLTQIICQECDRIKTLVDSMEDFSDIPSLELTAVNIHHSINQALDVAKAGFASEVSLKTLFDPSLPKVFANHDALVQVTLNLVKNACEAISQVENKSRGEITIKTAYSHEGPALLSKPQTPTPIEITIEDNGSGISEGIMNSLFEPFVTSKKVGKGLGLALVRKLLTAQQGHITVKNTQKGAQFKLYLPVFKEFGSE